MLRQFWLSVFFLFTVTVGWDKALPQPVKGVPPEHGELLARSNPRSTTSPKGPATTSSSMPTTATRLAMTIGPAAGKIAPHLNPRHIPRNPHKLKDKHLKIKPPQPKAPEVVVTKSTVKGSLGKRSTQLMETLTTRSTILSASVAVPSNIAFQAHKESLQMTVGPAQSNVETIWYSPQMVRGLVLVLHDCGGGAPQWFSGCTGCVGLPEEGRVVQAALSRRMAVIAISSKDTATKCFAEEDSIRIITAVNIIRDRLGFQNLPTYGVGISSGAAALARIANNNKVPLGYPMAMSYYRDRINLKGVLLMSAAPLVDTFPNNMKVVFTSMPRNAIFSQVGNRIVELREKNPDYGNYLLNNTCDKKPLDALYFHNGWSVLNSGLSALIFEKFKNSGHLDTLNYIKDSYNPRGSNWQAFAQDATGLLDLDTLQTHNSPTEELLSVAFGRFGICTDHIQESLTFLTGRNASATAATTAAQHANNAHATMARIARR